MMITKPRQGRPIIAHRFIGGLQSCYEKSPLRDDSKFLSPLGGLLDQIDLIPPMNRWAIIYRPYGTETRIRVPDTTNFTC
ncbi:MAG: hypothetical protein JWM11_7971 [Planctomycetaceae bacterium]|nr:hypothetical protein [Planctomycetaceae bacterium]